MPKIIEDFVYINIKNGIYILHTKEPFLVGRVWLYKNEQALAEQIEKLKPLTCSQMSSFNIAVTLWAVLGDRLIVHSEVKAQLKQVMDKMLNWYIEETNLEKKESFNKYKVGQH